MPKPENVLNPDHLVGETPEEYIEHRFDGFEEIKLRLLQYARGEITREIVEGTARAEIDSALNTIDAKKGEPSQ